MTGICAIISEPLFDLKEKIELMLEWCRPNFAKATHAPFIYTENMLACGANNTKYVATNSDKKLFCLFNGSLYRKEKLDLISNFFTTHIIL